MKAKKIMVTSLNKIIFLLLFIFLLPETSIALICPTNFSQVNIGDPIATIQQQCGKPTVTSTKDIENTPQEWSYFVPQPVNSTGFAQQTTPGTLKTTIAFDASGKLINIAINGVSVGSAQFCNMPIQLGDTQEAVKAACGSPSFINKQQSDDSKIEKHKITELLYKTTPPVTFVFIDGVLKEKK